MDNIATTATCMDNIATCVDNYRKLWKINSYYIL